jgi:hypothetical protein
MEEYLKNNGFRIISRCECGGIPQRKYYNPAFPLYKVLVYYRRGTFLILKNNMRFGGECKGEELEQKLKSYGITDKI